MSLKWDSSENCLEENLPWDNFRAWIYPTSLQIHPKTSGVRELSACDSPHRTQPWSSCPKQERWVRDCCPLFSPVQGPSLGNCIMPLQNNKIFFTKLKRTFCKKKIYVTSNLKKSTELIFFKIKYGNEKVQLHFAVKLRETEQLLCKQGQGMGWGNHWKILSPLSTTGCAIFIVLWDALVWPCCFYWSHRSFLIELQGISSCRLGNLGEMGSNHLPAPFL